MHTLHWVAIEADSIGEAAGTISDNLTTNEDGYRLADWSDWHVVGGGRWNSGSDSYTNSTNMIISYKDNPTKFKETLQGIKDFRIEYLNKKLLTLDTAVDKLKSDIVDYISNNCRLESSREFDFSRWDIKDCINTLSSEWTPDSHFYDNQEFTSKFQYLEERLDNEASSMRQYLVPVDFHF